MAIRARVTELEFYSSGLETIFIVRYDDGGVESFAVDSTKIYANETIDGKKFGRLIDDNTEDRLDAQ